VLPTWIRDEQIRRSSLPISCLHNLSQGSYGGLLTVLARIRHPETFYGSLAVSPALRSFGAAKSLKDNPYVYAATDMVANIYWDADADAARKIRDALKELDACGKGKKDSPR